MAAFSARHRGVCALSAVASACVLLAASEARAQVSPEEHAKHHPGAAGAGDAPGKGPGMGGMMGGGMGGMMDEMMKKMGAPKPRELYPTLMNLPELTPEKRTEISSEARERMQSGTRMIAESLDGLNAAAVADDWKAMQEATARLREGLSRFDSGVAAERALAEGKAPRDIALQWFQRQMNLAPAVSETRSFELWGMSPFHTAIMAGLVIFAGAMIAMYFFKMQRAASLLRGLTGEAPAPVAAKSAAAAPEPSAPQGATALPTPKKWSGKLKVAQIFDETPTVKTFRLMNPLGGALPFQFLPGQFLTVRIVENGKPVKRSYTIASSPTHADYAELTVKHAPGGEVSGFLHEQARPGDLLEFSGPSGAFIFTGRECKCILLIGGGVGITPLMSVLRYLTDRSWPGDIYLLYSIGTPDEFIFREELHYLQRRHANLRVMVTVSKPEGTEWKGRTGRITPEWIRESVPDLASRYVHICGPVPMMEAAKRMLGELGVPPDRIKTEAFGPALGKPEPKPLRTVAQPAESEGAKELPVVTFTASDKSAPLPPDQTILDVADEAGVEIDNSCRVGTCGTCRVKLLAGKVTMEVEDGLEPGDKEQNIVLACQAKSTGNVSVEA